MNLAQFSELLAIEPIGRGLFALLVSGLAMPLVGIFLIGLNLYPMRFTIMHVGLLGIALGQVIGIEPLLVAYVLCASLGWILALASDRPVGAPAIMGFFMVVSIALAFLMLSLKGVNATAAFERLWGSVLTIGYLELTVISLLCVTLLCLFFWQIKSLSLFLYDKEIALISGVPVKGLGIGIYMLISVSIATAIPLTGALLVDAVTILPALSARFVGKTLRSIALWSILFGLVGNLVGFLISLLIDQPIGPILVLTSGAITALSYGINRLRGGDK